MTLTLHGVGRPAGGGVSQRSRLTGVPQVSATAHVPVVPAVAFAVSQTTGALRLRWDPFITKQYILSGATTPAKGVQTKTHARLGPRMVSEYVSYRPPTSVGMTTVGGPWFFKSFGGGCCGSGST